MKYYCEKCGINVETSECPICHSRTINLTRIYWSKKDNIPLILDEEPNDKDIVYLSPDIRPVFPEERLLIEILLGKPLKYLKSSSWCARGGTYIFDGVKERILVKDLITYNDKDVREQLIKYSEDNTYEYFNEHMARFIEKNKARYDS